jgi:hypothetical protein
MAWGTAPLFRIIEEEILRRRVRPAPPDDWGWQEGRPTPLASPLVPYNIYPLGYERVIGQPVVEPKYSAWDMGVSTIRNAGPEPFRFTSYLPINTPTFITDHHVIALRTMVESLWAPKFHGHIHLNVEGELIVAPLYGITHSLVAEAYTAGWNIFGDPTSHRIYSFGQGGIMSAGHTHVWGASLQQDGGSVVWTAKLCLDHGGSIDEAPGNYEILETTYSYKITKYYRTVYSQDSERHFTHDLDAWTEWWQKAIPTTFAWDEVMGYCLDAGALWLIDSTRMCIRHLH